MKPLQTETQNGVHAADHSGLAASDRRTLDAVFRHPLAHNLEWSAVVALIGKIGKVDERAKNEFAFHVSGEQHFSRKPSSKDMDGEAVIHLRHFLSQAGWSPQDVRDAPVAAPIPTAPDLLVVIDHHEAKIYPIAAHVDTATVDEIKPYDPHHFLHHLTHKDQLQERGQRSPEDSGFYENIAKALKVGGRIVIVGHGKGKSNAAHHLASYLRSHAPETAQRIAREMDADLSSVSTPELLEMAHRAVL